MNYLGFNVRYFSIILASIVCLLTLSPELCSQTRTGQRRKSAPLKILNSNRTQDGLRGPVRRLRTEVTKVKYEAAGPVEGERVLLEHTVYDISGKRIDNQTYPVVNSVIGQETYDYDEAGRLRRTTVRNERGSVLSRTEYSYEFDAAGNWIKMTSALVVSESGRQRLEPVEVAYRTITYYSGDDSGAPAEAGETGAVNSSALTQAGNDATPRSERVANSSKEAPESSSTVPSPVRPVASTSTALEIANLRDVGLINDKALSLPRPAYPINWRKATTPIIVTVEVAIDETGRVIHSRAIEGPRQLWRVAEDAARRAGFLPFRSERRPFKVKGLLNYSFPFEPR
jgi:hypothetical protein